MTHRLIYFITFVCLGLSMLMASPAMAQRTVDPSSLLSHTSIIPEAQASHTDAATPLNAPPQLGVEYGMLEHPIPVDGPLIPVVFFFQYDPGSALAAKAVIEWKKTLQSDVFFSQSIASSGSPLDTYQARVFFALSLMKQDDIQLPLLEALADHKVDVSSPLELTNWLVNQGVNKETFVSTINGHQDIALALANVDVTRRYEIQSVPTIVLNGKYWIRANLNMTPARFVHIADFILNLIRQQQQEQGDHL